MIQILGYLIVIAVTFQMLMLLINSLRSATFTREQNDLSLQLLKLRVREQTVVGVEREKTKRSWAGARKFRIEKRVDEGGGICSFYFTAHDGKALPPFLPGQYLTFSLDIPDQNKTVVRCYSLSDSPHKRGTYRISIKRLPPPTRRSLFSTWTCFELFPHLFE